MNTYLRRSGMINSALLALWFLVIGSTNVSSGNMLMGGIGFLAAGFTFKDAVDFYNLKLNEEKEEK